MSGAVLVPVHGANHSAACWQPTVDGLAGVAPGLEVLSVDLPGRGTSTIDLDDLTVGACVVHVVEQIDDADIDEVVLVGHSLGGIVVSGVAIRLGPDRVRRLVFLAATIPPDGGAVVDTLGRGMQFTVRVAARRRRLASYPRRLADANFCNGMSDLQRRFVLDNLVPDAPWLITEPVSRAGLSARIPRTWVLTTDDRAVSPDQQRRNIDHLGGVDEVIELATCHDAMVSAPGELAGILAALTHEPASR